MGKTHGQTNSQEQGRSTTKEESNDYYGAEYFGDNMIPLPVQFGMEILALQLRMNQAYFEGFTKGFEEIYQNNVKKMRTW
jgi:hypothetical protein